MTDGETAKLVLEAAILVASAAGTVLVALVKRSVADQDQKLDALGTKLDGISEKVGEHAERLAEGKAEMHALRRELDEAKKKLESVAMNGCARVCASARNEIGA